MDDKLRQLRAPLVAVSAVPNKQLHQVVELLNREVGCQTCLAAFLAHDADTNVGGLDHRHVISAISYAAHALLCILFDELGDLGLLRRRATAGDHCRQQHRDGNKLHAKVRQQQM